MATQGDGSTTGEVSTGASGAASGATGSASPNPSTGSQSGASGAPAPDKNAGNEAWTREKAGLLGETRKEREARQKLQTEYETLKKRFDALAGVSPKSDEEAEIEEIRGKFAKLYPHLAELTPEDLKALRESQTRMKALDETVNHHWSLHSKQMVESVVSKIAEQVGELTDRQKRRIAALYVSEFEADENFQKRHDSGDKTLIDEFVKNYVEDVVEPVKRKTLADEAGRFRPVPGGGNRRAPESGGKPVDVTNDKAVEDVLVNAFKERGGQFGRR